MTAIFDNKAMHALLFEFFAETRTKIVTLFAFNKYNRDRCR